jgi:hypothetical protein
MEDLQKLSDEEIIEIFNTSYFLETLTNFIRCNKKSHRTMEVINKIDMNYLNLRFEQIAKKE